MHIAQLIQFSRIKNNDKVLHIGGLTGYVTFLLTKLSSSDRKAHVDTVLKIVSLEDRAGHKPNELSGGQQQRVAIARALVSDPQILVCDEPTGDLDRDTASEILNLLQILNRDHEKTILMVTHDPVAAEFAKRTLHLDKGKLTY